MTLLDFLPLFAGIGLFLYGMDLLSKAIERLAGAKLEHILETLTSNKWTGLALGTGVTAVIQSSAATTVTVLGFVNAGMMRLAQAIPVVFGANIGSTATAQILRLGDLESGGVFLSLLKPSTFAPILIVLGAAINLIAKKRKPKNIAMLLMGFGILFFGMTTMEDTLSPLEDSAAFQQLFTAFENPLLGILAGLALTALIQSSSAAVGILQALTSTGSVTFATSFPLLLGINIGKCLTVILASFGTNKNSRRVVVVHLLFNVIGVILFTAGFYGLNAVFHFSFLHAVMNRGNIADLHLGFNLITALVLMPAINGLISLATRIIPDDEEYHENLALDCLDDRFLKNPQVAMEQCMKVLCSMGTCIQENLGIATVLLTGETYDTKKSGRLEENEHFLDKCEASIGEYLVKTTHHTMTEDDSHRATEILQTVSDFERIGDYCVNISETAQYMHENGVHFTDVARREVDTLLSAVSTIVDLTVDAFSVESSESIISIEPLEEVIDQLTEDLRARHVRRLQSGQCAVSSAISFVELLNNVERISDHCSNIAVYIIQRHKVFEDFDRHTYLKAVHQGRIPGYQDRFAKYKKQFLDPLEEADKAES
ncbi:MAG: Na/Pi cotransporter family protein [Lachnospiraceae bacterium]|nr:Na/Pi cotransporter family protein [Lachnospiraceae bacterium]